MSTYMEHVFEEHQYTGKWSYSKSY